jgi:predicted nucleic acid-binding protein
LRPLVVDASVVVRACLEADGFEPFASFDLVGPALVRSEALSALHELAWRHEISRELALAAKARLQAAPVLVDTNDDREDRVWALADAMGWAKTYDAEYVELARSLGCSLVTLDARLIRGARSVVAVIGPGDLPAAE